MNVPCMLLLTVASYLLGVWVKKKSKLSLLHPFIICLPIIFAVLAVFDIPADYYIESNRFISFLLGPSVVALGLTLYDNLDIIRKNMASILAGIAVGSLVGVGSVYGIGYLLGLNEELTLSLTPKSVTIPIAMEISNSMGVNASITAVTVFLTGFFGAFIGPWFLNLIGIKNPVARGVAMGTSAHGVGTARAIEEGAIEGAVSGLSIALCGIATSLICGLLF